MKHLMQAFWQILVLRGSPQSMPHSSFLLGILLVLHLLSGIAFGALSQPLGESMILAALGTTLVVVLSYLLLTLYGVLNRLVQTMIAIAGCELLIGLMSLPFNVWFTAVDKSNAALPALVILLLLGWNVAVVGHIWRNALGVSKWLGLLFAIGYVILTITLASLFGAPEG